MNPGEKKGLVANPCRRISTATQEEYLTSWLTRRSRNSILCRRGSQLSTGRKTSQLPLPRDRHHHLRQIDLPRARPHRHKLQPHLFLMATHQIPRRLFQHGQLTRSPRHQSSLNEAILQMRMDSLHHQCAVIWRHPRPIGILSGHRRLLPCRLEDHLSSR